MKHTKKIMYVLDYFSAAIGGTERQVAELISNLDRERYDPCVALLQSYRDCVTALGCKITCFNVNKILSVRSIIPIIDLFSYIRREDIKIVHTFMNDACMIAPPVCKMAGARVVTSRRDMGFWYTATKLAALRMANTCVDFVVANCEAVRSNVIIREGLQPDRIGVIYNGHKSERMALAPSDKFRERLGIGPHDPIIGMVANLYSRKRPGDLLKAMKIVLESLPASHLVLVGGGKREAEDVRNLAGRLGLKKKVHVLENIAESVPIVKHFDVGVLCSESEGLSNAIIEYLGCGKATVCTDVGGNVEIIRDQVNGFVVSVGDAELLAERIVRILRNPSLKERLERNARELFDSGLFSTKTMIQEYERLYGRLVAQG